MQRGDYKLKVLQLLPELNEGGVERGVVELNRKFVEEGIYSVVISSGGKQVKTIIDDGGQHITFDVCSKNPLTVPFRVARLRKALRQIQPDIVHVRSRVPAWLVYFANKRLKYNVVSTVHGFNRVSRYSAIMQKADAVICVSNSIKEYIQAHYHTAEDRISVIPRGIDLTIFNPDNLDHHFMVQFKKKYGLNDQLIVTSVGRITQLKDYETFIKAIGLAKKITPNIKGLIVGGVRADKQDYLHRLEELIIELNLQENIVFTGGQNQIAEIYALSDVVVSCSKKPESFGRSVAESIAVNTPVIATNHGGVKDIIIEGENGFLFEVADEEQLSILINKAKNLVFDGFSYIASSFSLGSMVNKTTRVYRSLL